MNKIYLKDNYIIIESEGNVHTFSKKCLYRESSNAFFIDEKTREYEVGFLEAGLYSDDLGVSYTEATLRDFLRLNTGFR